MLLIVGLGNPGSKYAQTQHNVGFLAVDYLAKHWNARAFQKKFQSEISEVEQHGKKIYLAKPQTYMNLSGQAVQEIVAFYKLDPKTQLLVLSDDLDLPKARPRLRKEGGSGGHNGLKSIEEQLGTNQFARLRIGIGREEDHAPRSYVLSKMSATDFALYEKAFDVVRGAVDILLTLNIDKAIEHTNKRWEWVSSAE